MLTSTPGMVALLVACWLITLHTALSAVPRDTKLSLTRAMGTPSNNVGEKNQLTVKAHFLAGVSNNVTIDIISSYEYIIPPFVKIVSVSVGSNLKLDIGEAALLDNPVSRPGNEYFGLVAALDLGKVTNNGYDTNPVASQMSITFEVVMANNAGLGAVAEYWTSVGMEYNNSKYVCVCQVNNTLKSPFLTYISRSWLVPNKDNMRKKMHQEVEIMQ